MTRLYQVQLRQKLIIEMVTVLQEQHIPVDGMCRLPRMALHLQTHWFQL